MRWRPAGPKRTGLGSKRERAKKQHSALLPARVVIRHTAKLPTAASKSTII